MMKRKWSNPVEVDSYEMGQRGTRDPEKGAFLDDVRMRLEQTGKDSSVRYEFTHKEIAETFRQYAAVSLRKQHGAGVVRTALKDAGDVVYVYFARGKNWK